MNLLIDMGNTRLKWACFENQQLEIGSPLLNVELKHLQLKQLWQNLATPKRFVYSCVAVHSLLQQVLAVALELWPSVEIIAVHARAFAFGVSNAYLQPEKLGVDRWLALIATQHLYALPACIVDCGTAITVDVINSQGQHQGGVICPGLNLMKNALFQGTKNLPLHEGNYPLEIASHTEAAIYSGTLFAVIGLIEQVLATQKDSPVLILTGGDAQLIARQLNSAAIIEEHLVLRGLAVVGEDC